MRVIVAPAFWAPTTDASAFGPLNDVGSRKPVLSGPAPAAFDAITSARATPKTAARRTRGSVLTYPGVRLLSLRSGLVAQGSGQTPPAPTLPALAASATCSTSAGARSGAT